MLSSTSPSSKVRAKHCITHAGVAGTAGSSLSPILTYLQGSQCIYTHDSSLRTRVLQLLRTVVETAALEEVQLQSKHLLAMLLRMRASVMLEVPLGDRTPDLVSLIRTLNADIPDQKLMRKMHDCDRLYCGCIILCIMVSRCVSWYHGMHHAVFQGITTCDGIMLCIMLCTMFRQLG